MVGQADEIKVTLNDKREFQGKVVGRDSFTDLALVKIDAKGLPIAQLGTSKALRPGDWAIAIWQPAGTRSLGDHGHYQCAWSFAQRHKQR